MLQISSVPVECFSDPDVAGNCNVRPPRSQVLLLEITCDSQGLAWYNYIVLVKMSTKRHMGSNDSAQLRHGSLIARSNLSGES